MMVYICDIDGTVADLSHRLNFIEKEPKDWPSFFAACDGDSPITPVINVIQALATAGHRIIFVTGRSEECREKTEIWLAQHGLFGDIVMRRGGDHRPDTKSKRELMEAIIAGGESIAGVFEDRPSVCRVWREVGLPVFQMTDKEF